VSRFAKSTAVFSGLTMVSRLTGLFRIMAFTYAVSVQSSLADAYNLANVIPNIIYEFILGGLLSAIFIPILVREQEASGKDSAEAWKVANLLLGGVGLILLAASALAVVGAPYIIRGLTLMHQGQGAHADKELAAWFLRFFAPQMFFYGLNAVFMAVLNSHNVFAITAAAPILNNVVVIATYLAFRFGAIGQTGLAVGTTAGIAAMALVQLPWLFRIRMPVRPRFNFRDPVFKSAAFLGGPMIVVAIANLINTAVRTNLLSTVKGGFTAYVICFQLIMMPYGIFAVAIATVLYPALSRAAAEKKREDYVRTMSLGFRWTTFILLPMSLGLAILALPVTRALFEHRGGEFRYADSIFTSTFLKYYALSILPYALVMFATRAFYSLKDTVTPAWINVVGVVVNGVLSYVLLKRMSIAGVALAATICYSVTTAISLVVLRMDVGLLDGRAMARMAWKTTVAAITMCVAVVAAERYTRPAVAVIERGSRFPLRVPHDARKGTAMLVKNEDDWQRLRIEMQLKSTAVPPVNFGREAILLLIGPLSTSTSTLELSQLDTNTSPGIVIASATVRRSAKAPAADAPTSPAYVLAKINEKVTDVQARFPIAGSEARPSRTESLWSSEIPRLVLLVLIGGFVYVITAWLIGLEELRSLSAQVRARLGRRPIQP
jgi:putative peptidoglycan lipid II flippase